MGHDLPIFIIKSDAFIAKKVTCTATPKIKVIHKLTTIKKPSKIKVWLFSIKWHWKNRKWKNCRHKRRAFERALEKEGLHI